MKLVLNTRGTKLSKSGECFVLKNGDQKEEISARKVEQIMATTSISITSDALELAVENNIDVLFLTNYGKPFARVWHSKMGSITTIRRKQLELATKPIGTKLVKEFISQKMDNQIQHLKDLQKNKTDERKTTLKEAAEKIEAQITKIKSIDESILIDEIRSTMQGYEGTASRIYFEALADAIPEKYKFSGRSRQPANDEFNCMLNYGYGIMYSNVEKACTIAGLDPFIGIMHVDNYNRQSLVFDLIEMYRGYIDKLVFRLFATQKVKSEHFDEIEGGFYLNKEGKALLISEYNKDMESTIKYRGRNIQLQNIIQLDCHNLANKILTGDLYDSLGDL